MDTYILNGIEDLWPSMQGTNQVVPMNGTNQVVPMNGTNQVVPMNGTNQVVPMQGTNGTYYVSPLAMMEEIDVPLNGMPDDYDSEDIAAYRLAYLVGDNDAMNGLFDKFKEKRAERKAERQADKERKNENKELRNEAKRIRLQKRAAGTSFLDKIGGALSDFAGAKKMLAENAGALDDEGIDYDPQVLAQRTAMSSDGTSAGGGMMNWWNNQSTGAKVGYTLAAAGALYLGGRAAGLWGKKSKRK